MTKMKLNKQEMKPTQNASPSFSPDYVQTLGIIAPHKNDPINGILEIKEMAKASS